MPLRLRSSSTRRSRPARRRSSRGGARRSGRRGRRRRWRCGRSGSSRARSRRSGACRRRLSSPGEVGARARERVVAPARSQSGGRVVVGDREFGWSARRAPGRAEKIESRRKSSAAAARALGQLLGLLASRAGSRRRGRNRCRARHRAGRVAVVERGAADAVEDRGPPSLRLGTILARRSTPPSLKIPRFRWSSGQTHRIAPRWVRSAPKSKSTCRASGPSRLIADLSRGPPSPITSSPTSTSPGSSRRGVGAGARFRVEAPLRSLWMDTTIVELERAPPDRRAGPGWPRQPDSQPHGLGADRAARLADRRAGHTLDRARARRPRRRAALAGLALAAARLARGAATGCATGSRPNAPTASGSRVAGGNRYATGIP